MKQCEKLDQMCFFSVGNALLFVIRRMAVWRAARTLPLHFPSPRLGEWGVFRAFHHHQSLFLTHWLSLCLFGDFQCEQQLKIGCCKADTRASTNQFGFWFLLSSSERGESAITLYPAPESVQARFFFFVCFLYSNLLSGCRNANRKALLTDWKQLGTSRSHWSRDFVMIIKNVLCWCIILKGEN